MFTLKRPQPATLLYWIAPAIICLTANWTALRTWFTADDFVWLGLVNQVHSFRDFLTAMFEPTIHGTFRPFSERATFLAFRPLFGLDSLPFRILAFATQFANLALVCSITRKVTGSRMAAFLAPVLWCVNANLATPMGWASAYMQLLCGFCLLLALRLFITYTETERARYYWLQWAVFLFSFGVMESAMMYPALAASYALLRARRFVTRTLPMFGASAAFAIGHLMLVKEAPVGAYKMHFDASIAVTLARFWRLTLKPLNTEDFSRLPHVLVRWLVPILTVACAAFLVRRLMRRDWVPLFGLAWFVILLVPVLPLRDHVTPYYLTLPLIGLAMFGGYALACAWESPVLVRIAAVVLLLLYLEPTVRTLRAADRWRYDMGEKAKMIVFGAERARELHPGKTILFSGVDAELFWQVFHDRPFLALEIPDVYLAPETAQVIENKPGADPPDELMLMPATVKRGLEREQIEVYDVTGPRLKNITEEYARYASAALKDANPRRVDAGLALDDPLFGPEWYGRTDGFRWMPKRATVTIAGPSAPGQRLYVRGSCVAEQVKDGPIHLTVWADGEKLGTNEVKDCNAPVAFDYALPPKVVGKDAMQLTLEIDRTLKSSTDTRPLGMVFGVFEVK